MIFTLKLEPEAKKDIQEAIDWYNKKQSGLGRRFFEVLQKNLDGLSEFPFYQKERKILLKQLEAIEDLAQKIKNDILKS